MKRNKIYYRHGTMFSGKTLNLISTVKTYEHNNQSVLVLKHSKDTRDVNIKSRMSNETIKCFSFNDDDNLLKIIEGAVFVNSYDLIVIDEVQFCTEKHIIQLHDASKFAPIMCYGLKTSYTGDLFPAIAKLLTIAEDVSEIKTVCSMCKKKATHNLLLRDGKPIYSGQLVAIEGKHINEIYKNVCRDHFHNPIINGGE